MLQNWESLTFLHWRYDASALRRVVPRGLEVDTFDGSAWIGLVPFVITGLRPPGMPRLPWISGFPETNVRTYVRGPDGEPSVWFFTLEAARLLAVLAARAAFGLPYHWSRMSVMRNRASVVYTSRRDQAHCDIRIEIGDPIAAGELEHFLTARFRLHAMRFGKLVCADIEHEPWPLRAARVVKLDQTLLEATGFEVSGQPLAHFAEIVHTRVGAPKLAR
jgi:uncharacterized protein YqjF (DUF2071 family)